MKILNQRTRSVWLTTSLLFAFALCSQAFAETVTNTYDTLNRLTSVVYGSNGQQISYTYDAAGNRIAMSGNTLIAPDAFSFTPQTNVALNAQVVSNTITVTGINAAPPITITGGEYSISGGSYTIVSGNVTNGQTVTVRLTSSNAYSTPATATLTIGGISAIFSVTTIPPPATQPDAPTSATATASNAQAIVTFSTPANNGGAAIDGYTVTSNPAGGVDSNAGSTSLSHQVTGLTNGTAYNFTVTAHNSAGTSVASAASNAVTPVAPVTTFTVSASAGTNGSITPASQTVTLGNTTSFAVTPNAGYAVSVSGCGGNLAGSTYTTGAITANCTVGATFVQSIGQMNLVMGWNLIGNSIDTPLDVASVFGDTSKVQSVWKWTQATSKWSFYSPLLTPSNLAAYTTSKGYDILSTVNGGEGVWVNAKQSFAVPKQTGNAIATAYYQYQIDPSLNKLGAGWNLISIADNISPSTFNIGLSVTPPSAGTIPTNLTTLWVWDSVQTKWYFYAPSLESQGGSALTNYITNKGFLDFTANGKTLGQGIGVWVNRP